MKKILFATTAIAGLATVATPAMADALEMDLGGFYRGYGVYNDVDATRDFDLRHDAEIHFTGETTLDNGLTVGVHSEMELAADNAAVMMAVSGARGSMDNLSMMAGSIGQTRVRGQRLERGYKDRVLSHFERNAKGAREKGFVSSSFKRGLEPTEFFMLSVSGRESLVDTAVRTSKSGYMQRRLINAMDDLKVHNDDKHSVRNTADRIIQFSYGEDGTDPTRSIRGNSVNIRAVLDNALGGGN